MLVTLHGIEGLRSAHWYQGQGMAWSSGTPGFIPSPEDSLGHIVLGDAKAGKLRAHRIGVVKSHGCQNDASVVFRHIEIFCP